MKLARLRSDVLSGRAREIRELAHLSQGELARAIKVSPTAISLWEAGRRLPHGAAALRYAEFLAGLDDLTQEAS